MSTLQELGFTKEDIESKLIEKIAADLMEEYVYETETGASYPENSRLARRLLEVIKKHVDAQMEKLAQEYIVPRVGELIQSAVIKHTNQFGETKAESETFVEYLTRCAETYLNQPVDFQGNPTTQSSYSRDTQTRLSNLVGRYLHYSIESAMKDAVKIVQQQLGATLETTVKLKLGEIADTLRISIQHKA